MPISVLSESPGTKQVWTQDPSPPDSAPCGPTCPPTQTSAIALKKRHRNITNEEAWSEAAAGFGQENGRKQRNIPGTDRQEMEAAPFDNSHL